MTSTTPIELRQQMVKLVRQSIEQGLKMRSNHLPALNTLPKALRRPGASFVTLEMSHQLRGCIGSLEAHRPLAEDLIANGYSAAFRDPRFPPLSQEEYAILEIKISLLSAPEPMQFNSESDLVGQLQPGVDGLILQQGTHRGTFLPSVWEQLPDPQNFLDRLKQKAGLPGNHWSEKITMQRYRTEQFSE